MNHMWPFSLHFKDSASVPPATGQMLVVGCRDRKHPVTVHGTTEFKGFWMRGTSGSDPETCRLLQTTLSAAISVEPVSVSWGLPPVPPLKGSPRLEADHIESMPAGCLSHLPLWICGAAAPSAPPNCPRHPPYTFFPFTRQAHPPELSKPGRIVWPVPGEPWPRRHSLPSRVAPAEPLRL